ncbi:hypothetical protein [Rufibacter tibetensis]|uniref:Uncharacterized protein n=1 Tax=Rufibacter tibetensis TaxID=512763 RepID=A0A0P0C4E8_9BACT|nr:hypothetical protein [Rufibacter tibetensis]ALI97982.1 hypothetical protein DC20_02070 [Rufibacter tibetensis]
MKKLMMILAIAGMTSFVACDSQTGGNTSSAGTDAAQNSSNPNNNSSVVNPNPNDTTGATATELTQKRVGNSQTRGEENSSKSRTTQNQVLRDSI